MDDVPDLRDSRGRLMRLVLALTVAVIVGGAVYGALYALARPDDAAAAHAEGISAYRHARTAFQFVFYFSGAAFIVAFLVTLKLANHAADRKYARELVPEAKLRR
jgi:Na+/H+ antiporter NhaC